MYYFYPSRYTELCFSKIKTYLAGACLCSDLEAIMMADDDKVVIESCFSDKVPNWVKPEQVIMFSEELGLKGTIYKYQSYLEIVKVLNGQKKTIFSIISDELDMTYIPLIANVIKSKSPVVVCTFKLDADTNMLFDLNGEADLSLELIEPYLRKHTEPDFLELTFFKSLVDMMNPPKELIINILTLLKGKYHLVLNLVPIKNEFDLNLIGISDQLIFIASEPTKLNDSIVEQLRHFSPQGTLHEVYLSTFAKEHEALQDGLLKRFTDLVQNCI
ncbi:hypothetical protein [Fusibacter sp. 3D3]|uniref:hypothetical protein n=1 Tax=Fusibacter sp. 3D3 TaxID=1048380 RepID=UPI0008531986|nr:hypothetical protein [Fusibacter sp. 3D3]GAU78992.1 hypothetical protein F3D3_3628 [Fusibacter sp. 3D3]